MKGEFEMGGEAVSGVAMEISTRVETWNREPLLGFWVYFSLGQLQKGKYNHFQVLNTYTRDLKLLGKKIIEWITSFVPLNLSLGEIIHSAEPPVTDRCLITPRPQSFWGWVIWGHMPYHIVICLESQGAELSRLTVCKTLGVIITTAIV